MAKKRANRERGRERQTLKSASHANTSSSGGGSTAGDGADTAVLSQDLIDTLGDGSGGAPLVLPSKAKAKESAASEAAPSELEQLRARAKLTSKQKKRISVLKARRDAVTQRKQLYASLEKNRLTDEQLQLLKRTDELGQDQTLKQQLKTALRAERAGLPVPKEISERLYRPLNYVEYDEDDSAAADDASSHGDGLIPGTNTPSMSSALPMAPTATSPHESKRAARSKKRKRTELSREKNKAGKRTLFGDFDRDSDEDERELKRLTTLRDYEQNRRHESDDEYDSDSADEARESSKPASNQQQKQQQPAPQQSSSDDDDDEDDDDDANDDEPEGDAAQEQGSDDDDDDDDDDDEEEEVTAVEQPQGEEVARVGDTILRAAAGPAAPTQRKKVVEVDRLPEIQEQREKLPIYMEEQPIMEAITENDVVIICGETGSGKTTQVPQFLYEAGYGDADGPMPGMIGITQPRRVAAVSVAKRVATEMNVKLGGVVGYQIRYEKSSTSETRVKFMTDGVLLREIQSDFLLSRYSAIVLDEAHERNINTDILIGLLSRIVPLRRAYYNKPEGRKPELCRPLKLVIMSATLRVEDFVQNKLLFPNAPPVVKVDARQFPVTIHFNRRTPENYIKEIYRKTCRVHRELPDGTILVFMTGQQEIEQMVRRLRNTFPLPKDPATAPKIDISSRSLPDVEEGAIVTDDDDDGDDGDDEDAEHERVTNYDDDEEEGSGQTDKAASTNQQPMYVLPLYSMLPINQQMKVFTDLDKFAGKARVVVVATNVAETSLTIPGVRYVIDAGKAKEKSHNAVTGMTRFDVEWISKAAAEQRAGRAGRVGPGHCYRLYSSAVYNDIFASHAEAEIQRTPIDTTVLQMKRMGIDRVLNFPFPTPPSPEKVVEAVQTLQILGALEPTQQSIMGRRAAAELVDGARITDLGRAMSVFPVSPRFAKMLAVGKQGDCLPYVVAIVAALSVGDPLVRPSMLYSEEDEEDEAADDEQKRALLQARQEKEQIDAEARQLEEALSEFSGKRQVSKQKQQLSAEAKKQRRLNAQVQQAHEKWEEPLSDIITILKAVGAYECALQSGDSTFCAKYYLHEKLMKEIHQLRLQLQELIVSVFDKQRDYEKEEEADVRESHLLTSSASTALYPPNTKQCLMLRQILTSGLIDRVARMDNDGESGRVHVRSYRYVECTTNQEVYIHPSSVLAKMKPPPQYVVFTEMVQNKRTVLKGVTAIQPSWLPNLAKTLVTIPKELEEPPPRYDAVRDKLYCYARPIFGPRRWELPVQEIEFPESQNRYKWFARFLLEGAVISGFAAIKAMLDIQPALVTREWSVPKVNNLLHALASQRVSSRAALQAQWEHNPKFLLDTLLDWVAVAQQRELSSAWPPRDVPEERVQVNVAPAGTSAAAKKSTTTTSSQASHKSKQQLDDEEGDEDSSSSSCSDLEYL